MRSPLVHEINTRCWLNQLSRGRRRRVTLAQIPEGQVEEWRRLGFTHIWLMGVWATGPRARRRALTEPDVRRVYDSALPEWKEKDVAGSPYAIAEYSVPSRFGGDGGLATFRGQLDRSGLKLLVDFVPNHLGLDHPWIRQRPRLFVQTHGASPESFLARTAEGAPYLAHGKDPNFPAWTDTVQLDYRVAETRQAMIELLQSVAEKCDGVRCDMAMLLLNDVFARTWKDFPGPNPAPAEEFWAAAISKIKKQRPDFLFLAEAYWGLQPRLQALGFDYTYDKELYDKIVSGNARNIHNHLRAMPAECLARSAHFLENHDERRIAALLPLPAHRAAALVVLALPGMRLLHEGQLLGARIRVPVQLVRRAPEPENNEVRQLYEQLLTILQKTAVGHGQGVLLIPGAAGGGGTTGQNIIAVKWQLDPASFDVVAANLAPGPSQCLLRLFRPGEPDAPWIARDLLGTPGQKLHSRKLQRGLALNLPGYGVKTLHFERIDQ
jgi:hypothetical protein